MPTVSCNGTELYYERSGSGPRLLFINGSGATLATAELLISLLASHFDVVAHDQRGLGRSAIPDGPYSMAQYASDAACVAAEAGWERYRVLGISFGGMVAQELAVTFPERIERLALLCTSPGGPDMSSFPLHTLTDLAPDEQAAIRLSIVDTRFTPEWLETHESDQRMVAMMGERTGAEKSAEVRRGEALQLEARSHHDVYERLAKISAPTLVASGRFDGIAPPTNGEAIASQIPQAELRLYEGGHMFVAEDRTALPEIYEFLAR